MWQELAFNNNQLVYFKVSMQMWNVGANILTPHGYLSLDGRYSVGYVGIGTLGACL